VVSGIFFEGYASGEQLSRIIRRAVVRVRNGCALDYRHAGDDFFFGRKVEHELAGNRLQKFAVVTKCYPVPSRGECAGFEQRVLHAAGALLHGGKRLANLYRAEAASTEITHFLHLQ